VATAETIEAALQRLSRLHPKKIDLSLGRIERLLEALGRPQDRLPPTIHLAGTNGKGSTAAFLRAISEAAGERCHMYTSPHLVRFNERIVLAGAPVDDARLEEAFAQCEAANGDHDITFFEITTAAAFLLFSETPADRLILETGLGGRVDATNVLPRPQCTVITPVSFDHQAFLGDTIEAIAGEKAGIIKPRVPLILAPQTPEAEQVITAIGHDKQAPVQIWGQDFRAYPEHGRLVFEAEEELLDLDPPGLVGSHQIINAGVAAATARQCGYDADAISRGIGAAHWPARLQRLTEGTLADHVHALQGALWLDGGHNLAAAEVLAASLGEMEAGRARPLILICAFSNNKDAAGYLRFFHGLAAQVIGIDFQGGREGAQTPRAVAQAARQAGIPAHTAAGLEDAVLDAISNTPGARIVICGSLYLAGEVLAHAQDDHVQSTPG